MPAFLSASSTTGSTLSTCARDAISGTTPPYIACSGICEEITEEITCRPSRTIAAAVSSQLDSIAKIVAWPSAIRRSVCALALCS